MTLTVVKGHLTPQSTLIFICFPSSSDEFCLFSSQAAMSAGPGGAVRGGPASLREIRARSLSLIEGALFVTLSIITVIHISPYVSYIYLLFI